MLNEQHGPDQPARCARRLIWTNAGRRCPKDPFVASRPIYVTGHEILGPKSILYKNCFLVLSSRLTLPELTCEVSGPKSTVFLEILHIFGHDPFSSKSTKMAVNYTTFWLIIFPL